MIKYEDITCHGMASQMNIINFDSIYYCKPLQENHVLSSQTIQRCINKLTTGDTSGKKKSLFEHVMCIEDDGDFTLVHLHDKIQIFQ